MKIVTLILNKVNSALGMCLLSCTSKATLNLIGVNL